MWIKRPEWKTETTYFRQFVRIDNPYRGFHLDSDSDGNIPPKQHELLKECLEDPDLKDLGLESNTRSYWTTGIIRCVCHEEIHLFSHWANQCPSCEREYNGSGQLLAPRCFWGEETGEVF